MKHLLLNASDHENDCIVSSQCFRDIQNQTKKQIKIKPTEQGSDEDVLSR